MIARIWHGWTSVKDADKYEKFLNEEIFPGIEAKKIKGYKSIQLLRLSLAEEVEFITIMYFDSWNDVKKFAGENFEQACVPSAARQILTRFDNCSQHYEIRETRTYENPKPVEVRRYSWI